MALFVPHQANKRIIMSAAERLGLQEDRIIINIDEFGNTTAGTIPLALGKRAATRAVEERRSGADCGCRRGIYGWCDVVALGLLVFLKSRAERGNPMS